MHSRFLKYDSVPLYLTSAASKPNCETMHGKRPVPSRKYDPPLVFASIARCARIFKTLVRCGLKVERAAPFFFA
jgi:hypothetical protein